MTGSKVSSSPSVSTLSAPSKGPANLDDFAGRWHLRREIIQQNGDTFSFVGTAAFCCRGCRRGLGIAETDCGKDTSRKRSGGELPDW